MTGYVWGQTGERIEVPIVNERQRQTYYGALNYCTQKFLVKAYDKRNSESTVEFLDYLHWQYLGQRLALFWDGASYQRSQEITAYRPLINQDLAEDLWQSTISRLAPNAPEQNPVEAESLRVRVSRRKTLQDRHLVTSQRFYS